MGMRERIKEVRKIAGATQAEFAQSLGLAPSSTGAWERTNNPQLPTETMQLLICEKYGINKKWLSTGEGAAKAETADSLIDALAKQYHMSRGGRLLLKSFLALSPETQDEVFDSLLETIRNMPAEENAEEGAELYWQYVGEDPSPRERDEPLKDAR